MTPPLPPAWTIPPGRAAAPTGLLPVVAGRVKGSVWPALPAAVLALAWVVVMLALPSLMTPGTAPGPEGEAMPAVQAYVPGYLPGAGRTAPGGGRHPAAGAPPASHPLSDPGGTELAARPADGQPSVSLISLWSSPGRPAGGPARHRTPTPAPAPAVAPIAVAVATISVPIPPVTLTPAPATTTSTDQPSPSRKPAEHGRKGRKDKPQTAATVSDQSDTTTTTTADGAHGRRGPKKHAGPRAKISEA